MSFVENFPFPSFRQYQKKVLEIVENTFSNKENKFILAELGTGSGKSAINLAIARSYEKAYILTPQKILQKQYERDFGDNIFIMYGKSNYKCIYPGYKNCAAGKCIIENDDSVLEACKSNNKCPYYNAKRMAMASKIVVMNFTYFLIESNYVGSYRDWETDRKSTRLNSSHSAKSRMPSSA